MFTHRDLCKITAAYAIKQYWCNLACWELRLNKRSVADVIALSTAKSNKHPRLAIYEVKRTRADLLQDLKARKILKYSQRATHCYLAATKEALGLDKKTTSQVLTDLKQKGLPLSWGIIVLPTQIMQVR